MKGKETTAVTGGAETKKKGGGSREREEYIADTWGCFERTILGGEWTPRLYNEVGKFSKPSEVNTTKGEAMR